LALYKKLTTNRKFHSFYRGKACHHFKAFCTLQTLDFTNKTHFELACDDDLPKFSRLR